MVWISTIYGQFNAPSHPHLCQSSLILDAVEEARYFLELEVEIPVFENYTIPNFAASRGDNPYAYGDEYILINPSFAQNLRYNYGSKAVIGMTCHEVGHVRNSFDLPFPVPRWPEEAKADFYSGYCLNRINKSPSQWINFLKNHPPSNTHPPGWQRKIYIIEGYKRADLDELDEDVDLEISSDDLIFLDEIRDIRIRELSRSEAARLLEILEKYQDQF